MCEGASTTVDMCTVKNVNNRQAVCSVSVFCGSGLRGSPTLLSRCSGTNSSEFFKTNKTFPHAVSTVLTPERDRQTVAAVRCNVLLSVNIYRIYLCCWVFIFGTDFMGRDRCGWVRTELGWVGAENSRYSCS